MFLTFVAAVLMKHCALKYYIYSTNLLLRNKECHLVLEVTSHGGIAALQSTAVLNGSLLPCGVASCVFKIIHIYRRFKSSWCGDQRIAGGYGPCSWSLGELSMSKHPQETSPERHCSFVMHWVNDFYKCVSHALHLLFYAMNLLPRSSPKLSLMMDAFEDSESTRRN